MLSEYEPINQLCIVDSASKFLYNFNVPQVDIGGRLRVNYFKDGINGNGSQQIRVL